MSDSKSAADTLPVVSQRTSPAPNAAGTGLYRHPRLIRVRPLS